MITVYEFLNILKSDGGINADHKTGAYDYASVLGDVRKVIAEEHAAELSAAANNDDAAETLRSLILKYSAERMAGQNYDSKELVDRIYEDMAELGILTKYIRSNDVEEINCNSFDMIEVSYGDHVEYLTGSAAFSSALEAIDIVKRMVRMGGKILDAQTPKVDSFLGNGVRISASIPPTILEDKGVSFSLRKQNKNKVNGETLVSSGGLTEEMLNFLTLCLCNKVSIGVAGGTGSGKTTLERALANNYIVQNQNHNNRIYLVEDSHEIELLDYDDEHSRPARVTYNLTSPGWPMRRLIADALRYDPDIIIPAEVRDAAAYDAAAAGQTGHTILTSFHANNAKDAYSRLTTMCTMADSGEDSAALLDKCISSWPIMVYMEQLKDTKRRVMEIFEAREQRDGKVVGTMLYKYVITDVERDSQGRITKVTGAHKQVGHLSAELATYLIEKGVPRAQIASLLPESMRNPEVVRT